MKVKVAFYKGKGSWKNRVIRWWTKSKYSHAELIMPDNFTWISISPLLTSRVQSRINTDFNPDIWDLVSIEVSAEQIQVINDFFEETKGCKYDWIGMILSQFLPCKIKHRSRWYCSEWIAYALRIADVFNWKTIKIYDQTDLSPQRLYEILSHKDLE
jgi:hypothetical protein